MELLLVLLAIFIAISALVNKSNLYDFDANATMPLRGLLAIMIVIHHISLNYGFDERILEFHISPFYYFKSVGAPVVATFFFISGYGLAKSLKIKGHRYLHGFLRKRLNKILPEFLILTALVVIVSHLFGETSAFESLKMMARGETPLPFSWFMYVIMYVYIAFYFSALFMKSDCKYTGVTFIIMLALYALVVKHIGFGSWWYLTIPAVPIGYYTAFYESKIDVLLSHRYIIVLLCGITLIYAFVMENIPGSQTVGALLFACLVYLCSRLAYIKYNRQLMVLGGLSLYIYLVHGIVLQISSKFGFYSYAAVVIVPIASVILAMAIKGARTYMDKRLLSLS